MPGVRLRKQLPRFGGGEGNCGKGRAVWGRGGKNHGDRKGDRDLDRDPILNICEKGIRIRIGIRF